MRRVNGVSRNAIILIAGILAGLSVFFHVLTSPLTADAAADLNAVSMAVSDKPLLNEQVNDSLINTQSDIPEAIVEINENPLLVRTSDVLTSRQLQRLRDASLDYVALTPAEGIQMARSLNIVKND